MMGVISWILAGRRVPSGVIAPLTTSRWLLENKGTLLVANTARLGVLIGLGMAQIFTTARVRIREPVLSGLSNLNVAMGLLSREKNAIALTETARATHAAIAAPAS